MQHYIKRRTLQQEELGEPTPAVPFYPHSLEIARVHITR